jgi:pimeloyl-ACP methyl ester carboxylesterase
MPHVEGVEHRYVEANGVRLHVAEAGSPDAEPVVMLHGWPQHWWEWREMIPPLAQRYRVICPDLRGYGWSDVPEEGYEPEVFASDLIALMDELELDRVRLVGHDWGGLASFIACLRHPERFERLLALNIIHPWLRLRPGLALSGGWRLWYQVAMGTPVLSPALVPRVTAFINRRIRGSSGDPGCWRDGVLEVFTDQMREPRRAGAHSKLYRWSLSPGGLLAIARGRYRGMRLRTPTLLLFGTDDFAIDPLALDGWEEHADDMRVELVPGVGHFIVDERPTLVLDHALDFFEAW